VFRVQADEAMCRERTYVARTHVSESDLFRLGMTKEIVIPGHSVPLFSAEALRSYVGQQKLHGLPMTAFEDQHVGDLRERCWAVPEKVARLPNIADETGPLNL
jgi:hypothetical protein